MIYHVNGDDLDSNKLDRVRSNGLFSMEIGISKLIHRVSLCETNSGHSNSLRPNPMGSGSRLSSRTVALP